MSVTWWLHPGVNETPRMRLNVCRCALCALYRRLEIRLVHEPANP